MTRMAFRAWQRLKQRFEFGLAARQSIVMAEFSGMVQKSQELRKRKPTTRVPQSSSKMSKKIDPDCVKAINADDGWEEIDFALDSGDTETVMGEDMLSSEIKEGAASKRRVEDEIATWALFPNLMRRSFRPSVKRA